jgi:hypothetical protein
MAQHGAQAAPGRLFLLARGSPARYPRRGVRPAGVFHESPQLRQIVPRAVVHQPAGGLVQPLAGVAEIGQFRLFANPHLAKRRIHHLAALDPQAIRIAEHARAAQVIAVLVIQSRIITADDAECPTGPQSEALVSLLGYQSGPLNFDGIR